MKKLFIAAIMLLGITFSAQAQSVSENALGLRLGSSNGFGTEVSYQRLLSKSNRLELDLGFANHNSNGNGSDYDSNSVQLTGVYQWLWNIEGGFNWYAGVGASAGSYSWEHAGYSDSEFNIGVVGDIGIEYDFEEAPIQLSVDYRPGITIVGSENSGYHGSAALAIRYRF